MGSLRTVAAGALLVVGLTAGSATAGALVTGAQIKDNTVRAADLKDGSLSGRDVRDGSLELRDVEQLPVGPKGEAGVPGLPGSNGVPGLQYRMSTRTLAPGERLAWVVECGFAETAVSGGIASTRPDGVTIERSAVNPPAWSVQVHNGTTKEVLVEGRVLCVPD